MYRQHDENKNKNMTKVDIMGDSTLILYSNQFYSSLFYSSAACLLKQVKSN